MMNLIVERENIMAERKEHIFTRVGAITMRHHLFSDARPRRESSRHTQAAAAEAFSMVG